MALLHQKWISYDRVLEPSLENFLSQSKPSCKYSIQIEWICVSQLRVGMTSDVGDHLGLISAWDSLCIEKRHRLFADDLQRLAVKFNCISGKWLIFVARRDVDRLWSLVAHAVMTGRLGVDAKVSTANYTPRSIPEFEVNKTKKKCKWTENLDFKYEMPSNSGDAIETREEKKGRKDKEKSDSAVHVICVYSPDFNNIEEVFSLREKLRKLGFDRTLKFKPDSYSFCGVYFNNRWQIPPEIQAMDIGDADCFNLADFRAQRLNAERGQGNKFHMWVAVRIDEVEANYQTWEYTYDACSFVEQEGRVCSISSFRVSKANKELSSKRQLGFESLASPSPSKFKSMASPLPSTHCCGVSAPFKKAWWFFLLVRDALDKEDPQLERCGIFQPATDLLGDPETFQLGMSIDEKVGHVKKLSGRSFRMLLEYSGLADPKNVTRVVRVASADRVPRRIKLEPNSDSDYEDANEGPTLTAEFCEGIEALVRQAGELALANSAVAKSKGKKKKGPK